VGELDRPLTSAQLHALAVVAAGETTRRPARRSGTTTSPAAFDSARWFNVHYRTARQLVDAGLVVDRLDPRGDGLFLTDTGRAALAGAGAA